MTEIKTEKIKLPALRRIRGDNKNFYVAYKEVDGRYCLAKFIQKGVFGVTSRFFAEEELERLSEEEFQQALAKIGPEYEISGVPLTDHRKSGLDR